MGDVFPEQLDAGGLTMRPPGRAVEPRAYLDRDDLRVARTRAVALPDAASPADVPDLFADGAAPHGDGSAGQYAADGEESNARYAAVDADGRLRAVAGIAVQWPLDRAAVGVQAGVEDWRRGDATVALSALAGLAFDRFGLSVVATGHLPDRPVVRERLSSFTERHGGGRDGRFTNWIVAGGRPRDLVRYTIEAEGWTPAEGHP